MGLNRSDADEAFSEGLVAITEACQSYDPNKNVPLANWLALNIRWSINNWRRRQRREITGNLIGPSRNALEGRIALNEVLARARVILTPEERLVVLAEAAGFSGKEIARKLRIKEVQISRLKIRAQIKLKKELM